MVAHPTSIHQRISWKNSAVSTTGGIVTYKTIVRRSERKKTMPTWTCTGNISKPRRTLPYLTVPLLLLPQAHLFPRNTDGNLVKDVAHIIDVVH